MARFELILLSFGAWLGVQAVTSSARAETAASSASSSSEAAPSAVGAFLDLEWRVMGLANHVSHGPAFAAGVSLFDGALRLGIGGLSRPGPFNPATFDVTIPDGATYKGQSVVSLRSDGAMAGVHVGYSQPLPVRGLRLELPVTVGYGGFGYYLAGSDRDTPDGRRVSEWEDELFDDRDSYLGVVIDAGLRFRYEPESLPFLSPYAGVAYTAVPGYEAIVPGGYAGFSGVLGVELGFGSRR